MQAWPFQRGTTVRSAKVSMSPTAQASVGARVATPSSSLDCAPGFGLATLDHFLPFQCSVSVLYVRSGSAHSALGASAWARRPGDPLMR